MNRRLIQHCCLSGLLALAGLTGACDRLDTGKEKVAPEVPSDAQLRKIRYMSTSDTGPNGRKIYDRLEQAKTCSDLETAMRWNRPPNVVGGMFHTKMVYLADKWPADLKTDSEVFLRARIESGGAVSGGGQVWYLRLPDNTRIQAVEGANFLEKQAAADVQDHRFSAIVRPTTPGRAFCGQGVFKGNIGQEPNSDQKLPQIALVYAMDRDK